MPDRNQAECPACRYDFRGLVHEAEVTCPECGRRWSRGELHRLLNGGPRLRAWLMPLLAAPATYVVAAFLRVGRDGDFIAPFVLLGSWTCLTGMVVTLVRWERLNVPTMVGTIIALMPVTALLAWLWTVLSLMLGGAVLMAISGR
ncbi:MAG TPA: hypothetical protein VD997_01000 [Phycisphaerales bacterium]|nr:hypothetical protein [Phycisphaerales bacterium]